MDADFKQYGWGVRQKDCKLKLLRGAHRACAT